jgi:hypothetical protein
MDEERGWSSRDGVVHHRVETDVVEHGLARDVDEMIVGAGLALVEECGPQPGGQEIFLPGLFTI